MNEPLGLRERKKDATRRLLALTAIDLFEERGFDAVSVAEVAETAGVSKKTVFNYFAVKEDLVLGFGKHHIAEPAAVVRGRAPGTTPLEAVRDHLLTALAERQPMAGLSDDPLVLRIRRLVESSPALAVREMHYQEQSRELLARALIEEGASELSARLIAAQLLSVRHVLAGENFRRLSAGATPEELYPEAVANTEHAFAWLRRGFGDLLRRPEEAEEPGKG
ncbi:TetR/AcrR family transcriptional regulator [Nocardiopsis potens]|uniref:TetR/AcrR family transcriptional regulator n=1 Tax=Nocardiopsis potens TaxID=1246458 RepID=UPI0003486EA1|nr:TetR/AcrR family transcriptional regulator [Nocardiopsis potens]